MPLPREPGPAGINPGSLAEYFIPQNQILGTLPLHLPPDFFPACSLGRRFSGTRRRGGMGAMPGGLDASPRVFKAFKHLLLLGLIKALGGSPAESRIAYLFERHSATP